jgi:uncharacterized protein (TIGR01244 family)
MRKAAPLAALALAVFAALAVDIPASVDNGEIPNYQKVRPDLATAGQPAPGAVRKLKEMGFRTVVNLRTPAEGIEKDKTVVEELGLRWVHVPISAASFSAKDVEMVANVLDDPAAGPTLLYCSSANRVGAVWALYQVKKGRSAGEALAEGRKIGLKSPQMVEAVERILKPAN